MTPVAPSWWNEQRAADELETNLRHAFQQGIIDLHTFNQKLRVARALAEPWGAGCLEELPTRAHGDTQRLDLRDQWQTVTPKFCSRAAAMTAVATGQVVHGNNRGEWKYNTHASGGGSKKYMHCNRHVGCRVYLRFRELPDHSWVVQVTSNVMHSTDLNNHKRVNSPLTMDQERACSQYVQHGYTPKECKEALQCEVIVRAGGIVPKKLTGGIQGG